MRSTVSRTLKSFLAGTTLMLVTASGVAGSDTYSGYKDCNNGWDIGGQFTSSANYISVAHYQNGKYYGTYVSQTDSYFKAHWLNYGSIHASTPGTFRLQGIVCYA